MKNQMTLHDRSEISERAPAPLELAGRVANRAAATHAVDDYLKRKARQTIRNQAAGLSLFADYLNDAAAGLGADMATFASDVATWAGDEADVAPDPPAWRGVTWGLVEGFLRWMLAAGYAVATINNRLSAVKVYARLASKAGYISPDELKMIQNVSGYAGSEASRIDDRRDQTRIEETTYERNGETITRTGGKKAEHVSLTPEQAAALKEHEDKPQGRRDALLMCLLLDHGLRVSEAAGLQVSSFDLKAGEMHFYRPKVDKWQRHTLTADTLRAAVAYFEEDAPAIGPALVGSTRTGELTGRPMSKRAITKRVRYLGRRRLGLEKLSAHDCRHFWATDAARNGTDPFRLQEAGGWSSLIMPRRYVEDAKIANQGVKLSQAEVQK